ncbi:DNA topoisomerase 3-alpha [Bienertia sinuspersici]
MATQNSAGSASFSASRSRSRGSTGAIEPKKCYHNEVAPLRTVRFNGPTQGKRTCGFFKWADEVDTVNELQFMVFERDKIISELEYEKELLDVDVKKLRKKGEELQDQVNELAMENTMKWEIVESARAYRKFVMLLCLSWVFFSFMLLTK